MVDTLSRVERSERMARIKGANTKPELAVRKMLFALGYRYRVHRKDLPGKPDLVFPSRERVIFVHGCFWHQHHCGRYKQPKSQLGFWKPKLAANVRRDLTNRSKLRRLGWRSLIVWECELRKPEVLLRRVTRFLDAEARQ